VEVTAGSSAAVLVSQATTIDVPAEGSATLRYRVLVRY